MELKAEEKELISKQIEKIESFSSAELVAVVTKRSGDYSNVITILSIAFVFLASFIMIFFYSVSNILLLQIQLLVFVGVKIFLEKFDNLVLSILPKSYKYQKASTNANNQFYNLGLNRTKTRQGIMFFVSFDEKYVEIITDTTISEKIDDEYWEKIVEQFIIDVKKNKLALGYLNAIESCSELLINKFPIEKNDENELPNEVIHLR